MRRDPTEFRQRFQAYKEGKMPYENGLPKYAGGKDPYENIVNSIIKEEGFLSHPKDIGDSVITIGSGLTNKKWIDQYRAKGSWSQSDNRAAVREEIGNTEKYLRRLFSNYDTLPQEAKNVLIDIGYNVGPNTLNTAKSPKFVNAVRTGNWYEAMRQMDWGNNQVDNKGRLFRGLQKRNARRQAAWSNAFGLSGMRPTGNVQLNPLSAIPDAVTVRPTIPAEQTVPAYDPTISPYISGKPMVKLRPRIELPNLMQLIEDSEWEPPFSYTDGKLPGYKNGKIYIKPANRGKFTALKKRTGHSASWFKENGTPAQKKMAVFALNAKKWHHADGKLPEYGGGLTPVAMPAQAAQNNNVVNGIMSYIPFVGTAMDGNDLIQGDVHAAVPFLIGTVADTVGGRSLYKAYQARKIFMDAVKQKLSTSQVYPLMIQANDKMNKALAGAAAYASDWYENTLQNLRK